MHTIKQLEHALTICNEIFEDCPEWQALPDISKLRFAHALIVANENLKASENKA
jgi:hypothetical protein